MPPEIQLIITLNYYATGCFQITIGDISGLHQTTVGRIVARVSYAISSLYGIFIHFPRTEEEILKAKTGFFSIARFPRCVGALDCSHIAIESPGGLRAENFRNRKGFMSINVQGICDYNLMFINVVARWPGSTHDSTIFNNSRIKFEFENNMRPNQLLVADGGYTCNSYILTPLANVNSEPERYYNESQILTRNTIERCFGLWKRRFPVLFNMIRVNIELVQDIIIATAILHNIAIQNNDKVPSLTQEQLRSYLESMADHPHELARNENNVIRNELIWNYFGNL